MAGKKAEIEIQFNWIFVLIAGSLIFLFFFSIIRWAKKSSDDSSAITVSTYLDSIYTSASAKDNTVNIVNIPFKSIEFANFYDPTCDGFRVDDNERKHSIKNKILFAPSRLEEGTFLTWSMSWNIPFRISNFLFVSSPQVRYVFFGDDYDPVFQYLKGSFPEEFNAEFYTESDPSIENLNNFKVRFIYVNPTFSSLSSPSYLSDFGKMASEDVTALVIDASSLDNMGTLNFYRKSRPDTASPASFLPLEPHQTSFLGRASLLAAVFSDTPGSYECSMAKAFTRMADVAKIYKGRTSSLHQYYLDESNFNCQSAHDPSVFDDMISAGSSVSFLDFLKVYSSYSSLISKNEAAQQNSCSLLY